MGDMLAAQVEGLARRIVKPVDVEDRMTLEAAAKRLREQSEHEVQPSVERWSSAHGTRGGSGGCSPAHRGGSNSNGATKLLCARQPTKGVTMTGAELIAAERERQVTEEGWTAEHDDTHDIGQLGMAAAAYAFPWPHLTSLRREAMGEPRIALWPFSEDSFKPASLEVMAVGEPRIRELAKAGALIAAEIDRLQRVSSEEPA